MTQERAVVHNVSKMSDERLIKELHWLRGQEAQPWLRRLMIQEILAERKRRGV